MLSRIVNYLPSRPHDYSARKRTRTRQTSSSKSALYLFTPRCIRGCPTAQSETIEVRAQFRIHTSTYSSVNKRLRSTEHILSNHFPPVVVQPNELIFEKVQVGTLVTAQLASQHIFNLYGEKSTFYRRDNLSSHGDQFHAENLPIYRGPCFACRTMLGDVRQLHQADKLNLRPSGHCLTGCMLAILIGELT